MRNASGCGEISQLSFLGRDACLGAFKENVRDWRIFIGEMRLKRSVREFRVLNREDKFLRLFCIRSGNAEGTRVERKWLEAKDGAGADAASSQRPGHKFRQVIAGHVFHHFAAAARERAVWDRNGDANDQVSQCAKTQTQRATVVGGEHAANGGLFRPEWIKRQMLAVLRKRFLQSLNGATGFDSYSEVRPGVLDDFIQPRGGQN